MNQTARDSTPMKLNNNQNYPMQLGNKFIVEQNNQNPKSLKKGGSSSLERLVFDGAEHHHSPPKISPVKFPTMRPTQSNLIAHPMHKQNTVGNVGVLYPQN